VNAPRRRLKRWLARLIAVLVSVVIALVFAEAALRFANVLPETDQSNAGIVYEDGEHFYTLKPGLRDVPFTGISLSSNEFGYRCRKMRLEKDGATFRIALVGDSWAFGWGLEEQDTIASRLEAMFRSAGTERPVELVNFSIPGHDLRDHYHVLKYEVPRFRPDYCLVLLHLNDIDIAQRRLTRKEVDAWRDRPVSFWRQPGEYLKSLKLYKLVYAKVLLPLAVRWELPNEGFVDSFKRRYGDNSEKFSRYREYAEKLGDLLRWSKFEVSILLLPLPLARREPYQLQSINDKVSALFATHGLAVDEVLASYQKHPKDALVLGALDGHPNAFAADLLAREIFSVLAEKPGFQQQLRPFRD
jgi:lysophospholipase L1-like esterase